MAPRLSFGQRVSSLALFAVVGGLAATLIASTAFGAISGPFLGIAGLVTLMAGAVAAATVLLIRIFGPVGVPLASIFMLVMGNATSGGVLPPEFLPGWLKPLASVMPAGVGVRALDGIACFHHDGLTSGVVVLSTWIVSLRGRAGPAGPDRRIGRDRARREVVRSPCHTFWPCLVKGVTNNEQRV
ncbi:hypothetical protein [Streptomyces sp. NPDC001076]